MWALSPFDLFDRSDRVTRARSGGIRTSVLEVGRKMSSGSNPSGVVESRDANGVIGGGQRGCNRTGIAGSSPGRDMGQRLGRETVDSRSG